MSLDILEHPVVERLILGGEVRVQELREALVEFWEENNTFSLCGSCPAQWRPSAVGCCGSCQYHDVTKGCTLRNLSCLTFTCNFLESKLKKEGTWASYEWFRKLFWNGGMLGKEPYFNSRRLPDDAPLQIRDGEFPTLMPVDPEIRGETPPGHDEGHRNRKTIEEKIGESGIVCRVPVEMYKRMREKYPDSPIYIDEEAHKRAEEELRA